MLRNNENDACVIYLLTNKINNKIYVGQTWKKIKYRMGKNGAGYCNSTYLYNAIQYYGTENFEYQILQECFTQEEADEVENYYINLYDARNNNIGYNIKAGGSVGKHSEETKQKISETQLEKAAAMTLEERQARAAPVSGYWEGKTRGPQTEERKEQVSQKMVDWHAENEHPMLGQHHTEEAKKKISITSMGRKRSAESLAKASVKLTKTKDPIIIKNIIDDYNDGVITIKEIISKYNLSMGRLYRTLKKNGVKATQRPTAETRKGPHSSEARANMSVAKQKTWDNKKLLQQGINTLFHILNHIS